MHAYTVYHILSTSSRKGKTAFQEEPGAEQQHLPMEKKKKKVIPSCFVNFIYLYHAVSKMWVDATKLQIMLEEWR